METSSARTLTGQLAEDLSWLEQHGRQQPAAAGGAARIRLAAALVRNCLGPFLNDQPAAPLHIAVVGGAGAGKSTVANMLSGAVAAEANPQAGFTRHPIAFTSSTGPVAWTGHVGFLGPLQRLTQPAAASLDQDVYQVRHVPRDQTQDLLQGFVVWDCPDMTTWAATGYIPRLLEVAALADVLVYVASDERYNDEVPTGFLRLFLQAHKPVIVCLTKMAEANAQGLLEHFRQEVLAHMPGQVVATLAVPHMTREQLADPARMVPRYRLPLVNQVAVLGAPPEAARRRTVQAAMGFLQRGRDELLAVARDDLAALETWQHLVQTGQGEFETRYYREYLTSEKFRGFDEALIRLMDLLEVPGVGKVLSGALHVLRTPFRLLSGLVGKAMSRPEAGSRPELPVLEDGFAGWVDMLRKEAVRRGDGHALWGHVARGFQSGGLADRARERFQQGVRSFQAGLSHEVDHTARSIYEELEKKPAVLNTLRGSKLFLDVAAIGGTVAAGGIGWHDVILVPVVATLTQKLVEVLGRGFVDAQREMTRQRQQRLMHDQIAAPLGEWLIQWPVSGGSSFERLQQALRRIPPAIAQMQTLIQARLAAAAPR